MPVRQRCGRAVHPGARGDGRAVRPTRSIAPERPEPETRTWAPDDERLAGRDARAARAAALPGLRRGRAGDDGPNTEAIDLLEERDADDDAYLAELRKAMTDESPLGPREDDDVDPLFDVWSGAEPDRGSAGGADLPSDASPWSC